MRAELLHLSGPYRGKTMTYGRRRLRIGTAPDATLRFPQRAHVAKNHAEITFAEAECSFHLTALEGRVFVNGWEVREVILEHNDLLEIGLNGPKLRFHIPAGSTCKPVRQMLRDAHRNHVYEVQAGAEPDTYLKRPRVDEAVQKLRVKP